jgi:hypothetical protein
MGVEVEEDCKVGKDGVDEEGVEGGSRGNSTEMRRKRLSGRSYERVRHEWGGCARREAR